MARRSDGCRGRDDLDCGALYALASGSLDYQFLMRQFCGYIDDCPDGFDEPPAQFCHEMTTILSLELQWAPEPDIVIIRAQSRDIVGENRVEGTPHHHRRLPRER